MLKLLLDTHSGDWAAPLLQVVFCSCLLRQAGSPHPVSHYPKCCTTCTHTVYSGVILRGHGAAAVSLSEFYPHIVPSQPLRELFKFSQEFLPTFPLQCSWM